MRFAEPWAFVALLIILLLVWSRRRQRKPGTIHFPAITEALEAGRSWRQGLGFAPRWARLLALCLLVVGMARPQKGWEQVREIKPSRAIAMVLDRSPSMAETMEFQGQVLNRLEVVKKVFALFVLGNGREFKGRPDDLIGLVSFAGHAETVCPLTLSHEVFPDFLDTVQFDEGGTAIGDAIALAAARLQMASTNRSALPEPWEGILNGRLKPVDGSRPSLPEHSPPASDSAGRVMILLTDGGNNAGVRDPLEAAQLAARWGIRIYTVGIGGRAVHPDGLSGPLGRFLPVAPPVQENVLKAIAETTGGQFHMAEDAEGLLAISQEIDRQERSEVRVIRRWKHQELCAPFVLSAFLLLAVEVLSSCTVFRKFP